MENFLQDLRLALRSLKKSPGFTLFAVLTLALGIGTNTAIFSAVQGVLLRSLPFPDADRILLVRELLPGFNLDIPFNPPDFRAFADRQRSFEKLAIFVNRQYELSSGAAPERIETARVSANLFPLLEIQPILGRTFTVDEEQPGHAVTVLSYGLWQQKYAGDRNILGRTILLDRQPYRVIGVMPKGFVFPLRGERWNGAPGGLWIPLAFTPADLQAWGTEYNHTVLGRLKPGVTKVQAQDDAATVIGEVEKMYPPPLLAMLGGKHLSAKVLPYRQEIVGEVRTPLLVLFAAVALVLLIACANVANLVLARRLAKSKELAVRSALGATRARLLRQILTENLVIGIFGGAVGLCLGLLGRRALLALSPVQLPRMHEISTDIVVVIFSFLLSVFTVLLFGTIPAVQATRTDPQEGMREGVRGATQAHSARRMQRTLIVCQTALAVTLLTAAGLLLRSFVELLRTDPGFQPERVLAAAIPLPLPAYPHADRIRSFYQEMLRRAAALPGVISTAASTDLPLKSNSHDAVVKIDGRDLTAPLEVAHSWILGDYFAAMGITLLRGRTFTADDRIGSPDVVIVNERAANTYFPGEDPIGRRIFFIGKWHTVVGVVRDVKDAAIDKPAALHNYTPYLAMPDNSLEDPTWDGLRTLHLAIRTRNDPRGVISAVRSTIASLDPELAVTDVKTMEIEIHDSLAPQRFVLFLLAGFAALALFLASVGVYGVLSQLVAERTREFGVRMALGAKRSDIFRMAIRDGMILVFVGAAIGLIANLAVTRLMLSLLYGISAHDPITFIGVAVAVCVVALLACWLPASRAAGVDPMVSLRYE